jgi:hypothetical protein
VLELVDLLAAPERRQVAAVKLCGQSHTRLRQDGGHDVDQRHGLLDPHVRWDALASHELASGLMRLALHRVRSERTGSRQWVRWRRVCSMRVVLATGLASYTTGVRGAPRGISPV